MAYRACVESILANLTYLAKYLNLIKVDPLEDSPLGVRACRRLMKKYKLSSGGPYYGDKVIQVGNLKGRLGRWWVEERLAHHGGDSTRTWQAAVVGAVQYLNERPGAKNTLTV